MACLIHPAPAFVATCPDCVQNQLMAPPPPPPPPPAPPTLNQQPIQNFFLGGQTQPMPQQNQGQQGPQPQGNQNQPFMGNANLPQSYWVQPPAVLPPLAQYVLAGQPAAPPAPPANQRRNRRRGRRGLIGLAGLAGLAGLIGLWGCDSCGPRSNATAAPTPTVVLSGTVTTVSSAPLILQQFYGVTSPDSGAPGSTTHIHHHYGPKEPKKVETTVVLEKVPVINEAPFNNGTSVLLGR